jgi:anti-sigma B factor antagonist
MVVFTGINREIGVRNGDGTTGSRTWRLAVRSERAGDILVVAAAGRLGSQTSGPLIEAMVAALEDGHRRILCDLAGVDYASSAGLLALDAIAGRVSVDAGTLVLCGLTEPVRLVLGLSGLLPHFAVAPDRAAGLAHFAGIAHLQTSSLPGQS